MATICIFSQKCARSDRFRKPNLMELNGKFPAVIANDFLTANKYHDENKTVRKGERIVKRAYFFYRAKTRGGKGNGRKNVTKRIDGDETIERTTMRRRARGQSAVGRRMLFLRPQTRWWWVLVSNSNNSQHNGNISSLSPLDPGNSRKIPPLIRTHTQLPSLVLLVGALICFFWLHFLFFPLLYMCARCVSAVCATLL